MKRKLVAAVLAIPLALVAMLICTVAVLKDRIWSAPYPDLHASTDAARIERGRYLALGPAHCVACHGDVRESAAAANGAEASLAGGFVFDIPPGKFWTRNLTPDRETGIGALSDPQIARAMRYGVGHDGRALLPVMPFQNLTDDDVVAVLSYLRSRPAVKHDLPERQLTPLGDAVFALVIKPEGPQGTPAKSITPGPTVEYGRYLANSVANCAGCHTDRDLKTGKFVGQPFAGGFHMEVRGKPGLEFVTPNLTPHPEGRIAGWTEEEFVNRLRAGSGPEGSEMPWASFRLLSEDDARALYRYLRTVPAVENDTGPSLHSRGETVAAR